MSANLTPVLSWEPLANNRTARSGCGRFGILVTPGRRNSTDTVLFADGTRGTAAKRFYSLFQMTGDGCGQVGNYRSETEAKAAAETVAADW